jgi:hypothetical protein
MTYRLRLVGWLSGAVLVAASSSVLAATVSGPDNTINTRTGGMAGGIEVGFTPQETWLTEKEGDRGRSSLMVKVNPTTFVVPAGPLGGEEPGLDSDDAGLVHCFGPGANTCEFIKLGPISDERAPVVVNNSTVVVQGKGANKTDCEAHGGTADDVLFVVRGLGTGGTFTVDTISGLCLFVHSTDPIRVNDDTTVFAQPGADRRFANSRSCSAALDDEIWIVTGLSGSGALTTTTINVGTALSVHLGGSAAGEGVRVSDHLVVWASPGPDGHFASTFNPACGHSNPEDRDDGLVILTLSTPSVSFLTIGTIPGNPNGRPLRVNDTAVVLKGTGTDEEEQGDQPQPSSCTSNCEHNDDQIHVVTALDTATPTITTYNGFGFVRRPVRLNRGAIVAFEEEGFGHGTRSEVPIRAHVIRGIAGSDSDGSDENVVKGSHDKEVVPGCLYFASQELKTVTVTSSGHFHMFSGEVDETKKDNVGIVLNCNQVAFWTQGADDRDRQAFLLTNTSGTPLLAPSSTHDGSLWKSPKAARINSNTLVYTAGVSPLEANKKGLGVLVASANGRTFRDSRLTLPKGALNAAGCNPWGGNANQPVRLSDSRAVVLTEGVDCEFGRVGPAGADDGLVFINLRSGEDHPRPSFVKTGRSCGAPGCKPLALGGSSPDLVVLAGPGANGDINEDIHLNVCSSGTPTCSSPSAVLHCDGGAPDCRADVGTPACASGTLVCDRRINGHNPACNVGTPSCTSGDLRCSFGTVFCTSGLSCASGTARCTEDDQAICFSSATCGSGSAHCEGEAPICRTIVSAACASGSPTCRQQTPICNTGSPSCSPTLTCGTGSPFCPAGFTSDCPTARCTAKDDDELIVVSFP